MSGTPGTAAEGMDLVRTAGRSMRPLIREGALVLLRRAAPEGVAPGEIVVFRREGRLIAHRVLAARGAGPALELREKGDHTRRAAWIPGAAVVGVAVELRTGSRRRRLDGAAARRRIRWLTALSRLEADAVERYVRARSDGGFPGWLRGLLVLPAALLAAPARWLLWRTLLTAYPRPTPVGEAVATRALVRCFRTLFGDAAPGPGSADGEGDGVALAEAAAVHGLVPLLAGGAPPLPPRVAGPVRRQAYRVALDHERAKPALRAVARALDGARIPYAMLKGPYLYEAFYRDWFPREYEDFDLLVPVGDVDAAEAALAAAGYAVDGGARRRAFLRRFHFHLALRPPAPGWPPIELHWALVDRANFYRLREAECLARRRTFGAGEDAISVLAAEDELIYLCLHVAKHAPLNGTGIRRGRGAGWFCRAAAGNRLLWFADLGLLLDREFERLEWAALRERARAWNVVEDVGDTLRVLQILAPGSRAGAALERLGWARESPERLRERDRAEDRPDAGGALDWALRMNPVVLFRPIRVLLAARLFLPPPARLLAYHGHRSRWLLPALYLRHPFHMAARLWGRGAPAGTEKGAAA